MSDDPVRLIEARDPPAHLVALVRSLEPSPLPPAIRASGRSRLPRPGGGVMPSWRVIGPTLAVATAIGIGIVVWSLRVTDPQPAPAIVPVAEQPVRPPPAPHVVPPPAPDPGPVPPDPVPAAGPPETRAPESPSPPEIVRRRQAPADDTPAPAEPPPDDGNLQIPELFRRGDEDAPRIPDIFRRPPPRTPIGWVDVSTMPWSRVFVDGRDTQANTPIRRLALPAGRHVLGLRTPDGTMHRVTIEVQAGQTHRLIRSLGMGTNRIDRGGVDEDE